MSSTNNSIQIGKCDLCVGTGRYDGKKCQPCQGFGFWEFVADDNEGALRFLNDMTAEVSDRAKRLCGERVNSVAPEHFRQLLTYLNSGANVEMYQRIHGAASKRWGWAWFHVTRFVIALCKLNSIDHTEYGFGIIQLAWHWLEHEGQEKVTADYPPLEKIDEKNFDMSIDIQTESAL